MCVCRVFSLDTALLPDWSAASIQSYNFLAKYLVNAVTNATSCGASWLGSLFTAPAADAASESPLLLTPPSAVHFGDPSRHRHLPAALPVGDKLPEKSRLFFKIGVGELVLQPLGPQVGVLLMWKPAESVGKKPLRLFLPASHIVAEAPAGALVSVVKMLRRVAEVCPPSEPPKPTAKPQTASKVPKYVVPTAVKVYLFLGSRLTSGLFFFHLIVEH